MRYTNFSRPAKWFLWSKVARFYKTPSTFTFVLGAPMSGYLLSIGELLQPQPVTAASQSVQSQSARILLASGLKVTCESNAALSGTYPADNATVSMLLGVQNFIDRNARFPGGSQYIVADLSGNPHVFTTAIVSGGGSPPSFTQLVYALADFSALCNAVAITGAGALPSATTTIA